ncbi:MAG TPA: LuxR C-terminal-related transcriptional regulator, partial [Ilumatobacteraceae bacterium]|nr:LuxR C-terminal-related transcriptional regulator [Ilumatobacteraceae bacterium]
VESLSLFVQHLPAWLHVILIGRTDPRLPLDRLRVRGQLIELRFAELRFSMSEARGVLARLAPDMTETELDEATVYTDGWAAGVQLTGLAARSARVQLVPFGPADGSQLLTNDYVWHEVLAAGDPDVVDTLLQISVVDRVNAGLAGAITGNPDAGSLLLRGEEQGLFVYRVGSDGWFRLHALVRAVLLNELGRRSMHEPCHARAARWLESAGETASALEQWLFAKRPREALRLLAARSTELYDRGREATILRTIEAIPREVVAADVDSLIDFAVSHILVSRTRLVEAVRQATWHAEHYGPTTASAQIAALRSVSLAMEGDWTLAGTLAQQALAELGDTWWEDTTGRYAWNVSARNVALSESWDDDNPLVRDATIAMSRDAERGLSLVGIQALGHAMAGRPVDALRVAAGVRHAAASMSILRSELTIADAIARRELGDPQGVEELRAIANAPTDERLYCTVAAMLEVAQSAADDRDEPLAAHELARAQALVVEEHGGPDLHDWLGRVATNVSLVRNSIEDAQRWAATVKDPFWGPISRARVELAIGNPDAARDLIAAAEIRCARHEVVHSLLAARAASTPEERTDAVTHAVEVANLHGMLQTVASYGLDLIEDIERAAWSVSSEWLDRLRLAVARGRMPAVPTAQGFTESLTERERDVLRLLPSRLTLGEIAKELYVSVNTLKFHLRVIYRKLEVNSREEAAAIARSLTRIRPN